MRVEGLYKGNALCETPCNRGLGCEPIGVVFKAPLEPKLGLPIKLSEAVWMILWWEEECLLVRALEWGAEEAVSASENKSESARATAINQSSWGVFSWLFIVALDQWGVSTRATANMRSGHYNSGVESSDKVVKSPN